MPLRGAAFLAIWHDIEEHGEVEYDDWHTREHMPERVGIPGFEAGRRWVDRSLDHHRYFTLYEAATLDVLGSAAYRARLDTPTPWTHKVQPTFTNFVRAACRATASEAALWGIVTISPRKFRSAFAPSRNAPSPDGSTCIGTQTASTPFRRKRALHTSGERA